MYCMLTRDKNGIDVRVLQLVHSGDGADLSFENSTVRNVQKCCAARLSLDYRHRRHERYQLQLTICTVRHKILLL